MKLNKIITGMAATVLMASMGASAAMIKNQGDVIKIDARGLDLNTNEGQEVLYSRLESAARQMCGATSVQETGSLARALSNRSCVKETLSKAVDSVGSKGLTEMHKTS